VPGRLVIGAVLIPGAAAPKLVRRAQLATMKPGAVLVDVAIDQGGCFETSRPTTHQDPIYEVDGIVHYCVANMPGAVARTSTIALGNATLPFVLALADKGWRQACEDDPHLLAGLNVHAGHLTSWPVGKALGIDVLSPALALKPDDRRRRAVALTPEARAAADPLYARLGVEIGAAFATLDPPAREAAREALETLARAFDRAAEGIRSAP
jgi:hypothetical protein